MDIPERMHKVPRDYHPPWYMGTTLTSSMVKAELFGRPDEKCVRSYESVELVLFLPEPFTGLLITNIAACLSHFMDTIQKDGV